MGERSIGDSLRLSWLVCDWRSERISVTRANDGDTRASRLAIDPDVVTMLVGNTYTGRPSPASVNRSIGVKLRSTDRCWFRLSENVPSALSMKRASTMLPFHERFTLAGEGRP